MISNLKPPNIRSGSSGSDVVVQMTTSYAKWQSLISPVFNFAIYLWDINLAYAFWRVHDTSLEHEHLWVKYLKCSSFITLFIFSHSKCHPDIQGIFSKYHLLIFVSVCIPHLELCQIDLFVKIHLLKMGFVVPRFLRRSLVWHILRSWNIIPTEAHSCLIQTLTYEVPGSQWNYKLFWTISAIAE